MSFAVFIAGLLTGMALWELRTIIKEDTDESCCYTGEDCGC